MASVSPVSAQRIQAAAPAPQTTDQVGATLVARNTDRLGRVDVQGMVQDIKRITADPQAQRDVAAAAAKQIDNRDTRGQFVDALKDAGVARKPGFWERQGQAISGLASGIYQGGASLVGGVYDLGKLGVQGVAATAEFGYNYTTDSQYRAQTNQAVATAATATVDAAGKGLTVAKDYAVDRIAHPEKLQADAQAVDAAVRSGASAVADKADKLYDGFDKVRQEAVIQGTTDELAGKIVGRVGFEVAAIVVPAGIIGKAAKGAELAVDATRAVEGAGAVADAARLAKGAETVTDAGKVVQTAEAATATAKLAKPAEVAAEVIAAPAKAPASALTRGADRALAQTGDDAGRVARMQAEAKGSAAIEGSSRLEPSRRMFSSSEIMGIEPASKELIEAVASKRSVVIAKPGSDDLRMLDYFGAEASVNTSADGIRNGSIVLRENPSKVAVLEEFLHGTQARLGIVDRLGDSGLGSAETHVKDFMIRHQSLLGISDQDVALLKILRDRGL